MKRIMIIGLAAVSMLAACGVDKDGTADNLIDNIEKQVGVDLTSEQKDCLKETVKGYSDDELKELDKETPEATLAADLQGKVGTCLSDLVVPVADDTATDETVVDGDVTDETVVDEEVTDETVVEETTP
jgi:hypothetical protein